MDLTAESVGLSAALWAHVEDLLPWLQQKSGLPTSGRTLVSSALAVDATAYQYAPHCMRAPLRAMLRRALNVGTMLQTIDAAIVHIDADGDAELPVDIFTTEAASGPLYFARTASGDHMDALGSKDSWCYHAVLNGLVHPLTREAITGFGEYTVVGPAGGPNAGPMDEDIAGPNIFELNEAERQQLTELLEAAEGPGQDVAVNHEDALQFECLYKVPVDRSFCVQVLGLFAGTFEYFSSLSDADLEDLIETSLADNEDLFDDVAEVEEDDEEEYFNDVAVQIIAVFAPQIGAEGF